MMQLTKEGHALLKKIQIGNSETPIVWMSNIAQCIPQLEISEPIPMEEIRLIEKEVGMVFPPSLKEAWQHFGGMKLKYDTILCSPRGLVEFNEMYRDFLPEIGTEKIFFGGMDAHNFALAMNSDDPTVTDWDRDDGWTKHKELSIYRHLSERVAWYVTYMTPFCYEHGYVAPNEYR